MSQCKKRTERRVACIKCGSESGNPEHQFWYLNDYYREQNGWYCPKCFKKVARDAYGRIKKLK